MSFPLPESVHAADLEIYIRDERDLGISKTIEGHYYYTHPSEQEEGERVDPRTLVRPSAPLFGRYAEGDDQSADESMDSDDSDVSRDGKNSLDGDVWLEDISVTDEDFEDLFAFREGHESIITTDSSNPVSSLDGPSRTVDMNLNEESGEEDGEGESLYEKVQFGRNRVEMSFLAYNADWEDAYGAAEYFYAATKTVRRLIVSPDYISQGMSGMFYCPYPRLQPQCQWAPKSQSKRKSSRLHDLVQELKKTTEDSRSQSEECLPPSRRTNKQAPPPLRVRLLSASLQNRAMATRDALFQQGSSYGDSLSSKHSTENNERESAESLHGWELRAIASLYELEKI